MSEATQVWTQQEFNEWVHKHSEVLTMNDVFEEADAHDLNAYEAILFDRDNMED
ncbi:hypothetical protein [Stenotrophomonas virus Jojan60]|jgi:hypothetical protein|nr:hypothetical protein [Stenotrophomonas virus Jojan60]